MAIAILINGAHGRMGQTSVQTISKSAKFKLVGQVGRRDNLAKAIVQSKAQVVVDFTHPEVVFQNTHTILTSGAHPVIGTSGLTAEQILQLQQQAKQLQLGGIIAPNFSLAAVLMMKYAKEIAKYLPNVEIIEMHHDAKADSPSGTALRTAEMLALSPLKPAQRSTKETVAGARGANYQGIPIHAIRLPGLLAHQQIIFGDTGATLTLRHDSINRESFMAGLLLACERVVNTKELVYGLENILD